VFLKTEADAGMFAPSVSILLEFHKRVQKKNFPCNVGRIGRSPVDMARIFLFPINYLKLGHYRKEVRYVPYLTSSKSAEITGFLDSAISGKQNF